MINYRLRFVALNLRANVKMACPLLRKKIVGLRIKCDISERHNWPSCQPDQVYISIWHQRYKLSYSNIKTYMNK